MEKTTLALCPLFLVLLWSPLALGGLDYGQALSKSILFFEAQRSGYLPSTQRVTWRANSGLSDGKASGVDLVGGYYDAGDNVKFGLPMALTVTMMSWSILEYGKQMAAGGELSHAIDAVKWGADYFIKAHPEPHVLYGEVGDGNTDHYCWQRPEDMTTDRRAYRIDQSNPGSDLAGETAAAMAAASIVFRHSNAAYSGELLHHAEQLFLCMIICMMSLHMYFAPPRMLVDYPPNAKAAPENLKELKDLPKHPLIFNLSGSNFSTEFDLTTNKWLIDSGASVHCTPQRNVFDTYDSVDFGHVYVANGQHCKIMGKGTVTLKIPGGESLVLNETLHVPDLKGNLISTSLLDKEGYTTTFGDGEWMITKKKILIAKGKRMDSLYYFEGNNIDDTTPTPMDIGLIAKDKFRRQATIMHRPDSPYAGGVVLVSSHFPPDHPLTKGELWNSGSGGDDECEVAETAEDVYNVLKDKVGRGGGGGEEKSLKEMVVEMRRKNEELEGEKRELEGKKRELQSQLRVWEGKYKELDQRVLHWKETLRCWETRVNREGESVVPREPDGLVNGVGDRGSTQRGSDSKGGGGSVSLGCNARRKVDFG